MKYHLQWLRWRHEPDSFRSQPEKANRTKVAVWARRDRRDSQVIVLQPGKSWFTVCEGREHLYLTWVDP